MTSIPKEGAPMGIRSLATRRQVLAGGAAVALAGSLPRPVRAADPLTIITGSLPTAFYEVTTYVADQAGFFKAQNLDVTVQYAGNPNIAAQLIASGKGDIGASAIEALIAGYEKGVRLQAFFMRSPKNSYTLGVLDTSPIKTLKDFKGALIGEYSLGSTAEDYVNPMLLGAGLHKSDFSYIPIGSGSQAIQALTSQRVAGAAFPYLELALYVVNAGQKYRYFFNPIEDSIPNTGYYASPQTLQAKADAIGRFSRALAQAAIFIRVNPNMAARYYLKGSQQAVTPDALAKEIQLLDIARDQLPGADPLSKRIGDVPLAGMAILARVMNDSGRTTQIVPVSGFATDQFIAFANDFDHQALIDQAKAMRAT
jgi:NitT/TauT family transport system substrate-binding protein